MPLKNEMLQIHWESIGTSSNPLLSVLKYLSENLTFILESPGDIVIYKALRDWYETTTTS